MNNKKGLVGKIIIGVGSLIILTVIVFLVVSNVSDVYNGLNPDSVGITETILVEATSSLPNPPISSSAQVYNQTWLEFDGVNDWVQIQDSEGINYNQTTISLWLYSNNNYTDVIRKWESTGEQRSWAILINSNGNLTASISYNGTGGGTNEVDLRSTTLLNDSTWHHIALTYDLINATLYVDGVIEETQSFNKGIYFSTSPIKIARSFMTTRYLNGSIDDLRIYGKALNDTEILGVYADRR